MKYLDLFSGIGAASLGIHDVFPDAECMGFSEVCPHAIKAYTRRFPNAPALGDICAITDIPEVDLIVAGFPCKQLSTLCPHLSRIGLEGKDSGLIHQLVRIIKLGFEKNPGMHIVVENNVSMGRLYLRQVIELLESVVPKRLFVKKLNASDISMQKRNRYFFSTFEIGDLTRTKPTWDSILEPIEYPFELWRDETIIGMNKIVKQASCVSTVFVRKDADGDWLLESKPGENPSHWCYIYHHHDTAKTRAETVCGQWRSRMIVDRRSGKLKIRKLTSRELHRLFSFPETHLEGFSHTRTTTLLGNSMHVGVMRHVFKHLPVA